MLREIGKEARGEINGERWEANGQVEGERSGERRDLRREVEGERSGGRRMVRWKVTATSIPGSVSSGDGGSWVGELVDEIVDADDTGEIVELAN